MQSTSVRAKTLGSRSLWAGAALVIVGMPLSRANSRTLKDRNVRGYDIYLAVGNTSRGYLIAPSWEASVPTTTAAAPASKNSTLASTRSAEKRAFAPEKFSLNFSNLKVSVEEHLVCSLAYPVR